MKPMHASISLLSCALLLRFSVGARSGTQLHERRGDRGQAGATDLSRRCA